MPLCCDYRRLNAKEGKKRRIRNNFPMPTIDDVLECLQGANVYTDNLCSGTCHLGYRIPAIFSRYSFAMLRDLIATGMIVVYMDDLLIPAKDEVEGIQKLQIVLRTVIANGLQIK